MTGSRRPARTERGAEPEREQDVGDSAAADLVGSGRGSPRVARPRAGALLPEPPGDATGGPRRAPERRAGGAPLHRDRRRAPGQGGVRGRALLGHGGGAAPRAPRERRGARAERDRGGQQRAAGEAPVAPGGGAGSLL